MAEYMADYGWLGWILIGLIAGAIAKAVVPGRDPGGCRAVRVGKMKAMNFESTKWRREALDDVVVDEETLARRRRRRNIIIAVAAALLLAVVAFMMFAGGGEKAVAPKGAEGQQLPAVTVIVPGRQDVPAIISATGSS